MRLAKTSAVLSLGLTLSMLLNACSSGDKTAGESPAPTTSAKPAESAKAGGVDTSKEVKLKIVLLGAKPVDFDKVFGEMNKKMKEKINATLEPEFLDWADWGQKYPLKFAANEDFDLIYTSNWAMYMDQSTKGGFLELTDEMLKKYAPKIWSDMPKVNWDQAKINGKLFMVPNNHMEVMDGMILIRDDLRKKYNLPEVNSPESFATYLKSVAKNEKGMMAFNAAPGGTAIGHNFDGQLFYQANDWRQVDGRVPVGFKLDDLKGHLINLFDTPEYKKLLNYYKDLADNDVWPKNIVNNKSDVGQELKAGKVAVNDHNINTLTSRIAELRHDNVDYGYKVVDLTPNSKPGAAVSTQNGTGIHVSSKNPERALMAIDLLQSDREIHDLMMYGIAGEHYIPDGTDKYKAGPKMSNYGGFSNWGWFSKLDRVNSELPQEALDMLKELEKKVYHYPLETFVFDDTSVKSEIANINNVLIRYNLPLVYGVIKDIDAGHAELLKQLKTAGIEKVQQEMQRQIDAFLAKK